MNVLMCVLSFLLILKSGVADLLEVRAEKTESDFKNCGGCCMSFSSSFFYSGKQEEY